MTNTILFSENQRFKQWWLWLLLIGVNGIFIYGLIRQVIMGIPFGNQPMSNTTLIISGLIQFLLTVLFWSFKLQTIVKSDGIYVRLFPLQTKLQFFPWDVIASAEIRTYSPLREYGGWGMRGALKNRALNVSGVIGLQLVLNNGNRLLIGTQQSEALEKAIDPFITQ
ncbi:MAG: DUF6141 family protein [Bacteroidota bacterium]